MIEHAKKRIEVRGVSKAFTADFVKNEGTLFRVVDFISGKSEKKKIEVLKDISFDVHAGEILGVIGKNGTGKSTLLRLIAGVYIPDVGEIHTHGKVVYLTGLGQGSSKKLTMRENIYLMGAVMGLSQREIKSRFNEIVDFSGLSDFVDMKVYQFSTGMVTRLNFSVIMHCIEHQEPDILLLDEVLSAGGDIDFKQRADKKMEDLVRSGAAVIMVSHNLSELEKHCERIIWIKDDSIHMDGKATKVLGKYVLDKKT